MAPPPLGLVALLGMMAMACATAVPARGARELPRDDFGSVAEIEGPGTAPARLTGPVAARPPRPPGGEVASRSVPAVEEAPASTAGLSPATSILTAALPPAAESAGQTSTGVVECAAFTGTHALRRSALNRALDAGLGAWLGGIEVEPKLVRGRFGGWLVRSLHPGEPCWADLDLRAGDVINRVNHRAVERPEQAHAVWTALRHAHEISVDFVRDGLGRSFRLAIVDDVTTVGTAPLRSASAP